MAVTLHRKESDGEWKPYAQFADGEGMRAAGLAQRLADRAKALGRNVTFRVTKDEDAKRRRLMEEGKTFKLAMTADEIEHVYLVGPVSCRSGSHAWTNRGYAGPDLAVAYLQKNGVITARAVVWPARKLYSRLYGDQDALRDALKAEEYQRGGYYTSTTPASPAERAFNGARFSKVPNRNLSQENRNRYADNDAGILYRYMLPCMEHFGPQGFRMTLEGDWIRTV